MLNKVIKNLTQNNSNFFKLICYLSLEAIFYRIRKAYRMPDFTTSYNKCKSLTYLRPTLAQKMQITNKLEARSS